MSDDWGPSMSTAEARLFNDGFVTGKLTGLALQAEAVRGLRAALEEYVGWGAMTGSDRDYFAEKFRAVLARYPEGGAEP